MLSYFLSGLRPAQITHDKLKELGLGYFFESPTFEVGEVMANGPNDERGVVVGLTSNQAKLTDQEWEKHNSIDGCWIGYPKDITPEELRRESWEDVPSYTHKGWLIPIARMWMTCDESASRLPKKLDFKNGEYCPGPVVDRYRRLEVIGSEIVEVILNEQMPDNHFELAFEVASMVYRLGPQEFAKVGPVEYSHQSSFNYLSFVADLPGWLNLTDQKKTPSKAQG